MSDRDLPESRLFAPVRDWLKAQGYRVFAEAWGHDVVAYRPTDERIVVVELKTSFTHGLCYQARRGATFADAAYGAVPRMPRKSSMESVIAKKLGVLLVTDCVSIIREPETCYWGPERTRRLEQLRHWPEPEEQIGGIPTLAGGGDAQRVEKAIKAYLAEHPEATWRDIFRDVPNHYAHVASMRGAMRQVLTREQIKQRRKEAV